MNDSSTATTQLKLYTVSAATMFGNKCQYTSTIFTDWTLLSQQFYDKIGDVSKRTVKILHDQPGPWEFIKVCYNLLDAG